MFGKVFRQIKLAMFIGVAGLISGQAFGIGLGEIQLNTPLNEPLNAEIQLLQVQGLNENEILVGIAPKADFEAAGVDRLFFLSSLKFSLELDNPKGPIVRVKTDAPIREPYLNFLLEVQWPNGRLLREYTLLMDLPAFSDTHSAAKTIKGTQTPVVSASQPKPAPLDVGALEAELAAVDAAAAPVVSPIVPAPAEPATPSSSATLTEEKVTSGSAEKTQSSAPEVVAAPEKEPMPATAPEEPVVQAEQPVAAAQAPAPSYQSTATVPVYSAQPAEGDYTVRAGDNLWKIAMKYRPVDGVTIQQSMLAVQRLNPDAFIQGNINMLKKGKVLRIPGYDDLTDMTSREAVAEVRRQNVEWSGNPNGRKAAPSPEQVDATHQDVAAAEAPVSAEAGHLKLSVPSPADGNASGKASGSEGVEPLQNELAISMEELDRSKREKSKVATQLSGLDDQTKTVEQMLEVRSAELAALQASLAKAAQEKAQQSQAAAVPPEAEVSDKTVMSEQAVEKAVEAEKPVVKTEEAPVVSTTTSEVSTAKQEGGVLAQLQNNLVWVLGGVLTLIILIFAAVKLRNRKPVSSPVLQEDDFSEDVSDVQDDDTTLDDLDDVVGSLGQSLDTDDSSFEEPASEAKPETSDAIGEADIYISFGTYDKAESLLKNAIKSEPKRTDLRLKLLEVYVGMQDVKAFDKQFSELAQLRDAGATERAGEMRNKISGAASTSAPVKHDDGLNLDLGSNSDDVDTSMDFDLDLNLDDQAVDDSISAAAESLDFDLDLDDEPKQDTTQKSLKVSMSDAPTVQQRAIDISDMQTAVTPAVKVSEARTESRESLDLDLSGLDAELEEFDTTPAISAAAASAVAKDSPTPNVDLDEEFDFLADADEAATKLDLARAYVDMGDKEGAKDILQEVIEEGQEAQKNEARKLLEGIS